jgi:hypothetical protein
MFTGILKSGKLGGLVKIKHLQTSLWVWDSNENRCVCLIEHVSNGKDSCHNKPSLKNGSSKQKKDIHMEIK